MFFGFFGKEYAWAPRWMRLERIYIKTFGLIDLPGRLRARLAIRAIRKLGVHHLLDFGCGTGTYSFYFSRSPEVQVKGIDTDESRIADCRLITKRIGRETAEFYVGNGYRSLRLFGDRSFDCALGIEVFQYIPDLEETLNEMYRLLKPGGYLLGHVPVLGYLRETEHTLFDDDNIRQFLNASGFEIIKLTSSFGWGIRELCAFYDKIVNSKYITAILYPFLLTISHAFHVEASDGDYRFFIARKPRKTDEREQCSLNEY